jgi:dATP pyrophosphohydrolase
VTGSIEVEDDSLRDTAIREVMEETGLDATQFDLSDWHISQTYEIYEHWRYRYAPGVTHNTEHIFGLELPSIVDVKLAPNEHVAYEWVDWREAAKRVFSWTNVEALRLLGERHQLIL